MIQHFAWNQEKQAWTAKSEETINLIRDATGPKSQHQYACDRMIQMLVCYLGIKVIAPESEAPMRCDTQYKGDHLFKANTKTGTFTFSTPTLGMTYRFGILVGLANANAARLFASRSQQGGHESAGAAAGISPKSPPS